jgi:hypothetical protein
MRPQPTPTSIQSTSIHSIKSSKQSANSRQSARQSTPYDAKLPDDAKRADKVIRVVNEAVSKRLESWANLFIVSDDIEFGDHQVSIEPWMLPWLPEQYSRRYSMCNWTALTAGINDATKHLISGRFRKWKTHFIYSGIDPSGNICYDNIVLRGKLADKKGTKTTSPVRYIQYPTAYEQGWVVTITGSVYVLDAHPAQPLNNPQKPQQTGARQMLASILEETEQEIADDNATAGSV